jgi:hypothetical protein
MVFWILLITIYTVSDFLTHCKREVVITGSFNFIRAAEENNSEKELIIRSKEIEGIFRELGET